jgi:hypothetical protein
MTLLVRDEIDIIRTFLDFHFAEGVDFIIVTDNGSLDGTVDVLAEYQSAGRIEVIHEPPSDYSQGPWVTRMAQRASIRYGADWVINADADEFFLSRKGRLRDVLKQISTSVKVFTAARHVFVPIERPGRAPVPIEMPYRMTESRNLFNRKPLFPKAIHRGHPAAVVGMGNHRVRAPGFPVEYEAGEIEVYHYPIRSYAQFESKTINTGSGLEKNTEISLKLAQRPRLWYRLWKRGMLEEEYLDNVFYGPDRLKASLDSGDLVEDRAVIDRLREHGLG